MYFCASVFLSQSRRFHWHRSLLLFIDLYCPLWSAIPRHSCWCFCYARTNTDATMHHANLMTTWVGPLVYSRFVFVRRDYKLSPPPGLFWGEWQVGRRSCPTQAIFVNLSLNLFPGSCQDSGPTGVVRWRVDRLPRDWGGGVGVHKGVWGSMVGSCAQSSGPAAASSSGGKGKEGKGARAAWGTEVPDATEVPCSGGYWIRVVWPKFEFQSDAHFFGSWMFMIISHWFGIFSKLFPLLLLVWL